MKKNIACMTVLLLASSLSLASTFKITSSGYSDPERDKGIIEVTNRESFDIKCSIKAIGVAKNNDGNGPLKGRVTSLPVTKILKPNRAAELEFDFSVALEKMRRTWRDPSAKLVELGSANGSNLIDPTCERVGGGPVDRNRYLFEVESQCNHSVALILRVAENDRWVFKREELRQGEVSDRFIQRGVDHVFFYATSSAGHEWGGSHEYTVDGRNLPFLRKNLKANTIITQRLYCR